MRPLVTVMVCQACCCGTERKHPTTDHAAQRTALLEAATEQVRVRVVDCLSECDRSNVVLVREHDMFRRHRDTWLGGVLDEPTTADLAEWLGSERGPMPQSLVVRVFQHEVP